MTRYVAWNMLLSKRICIGTWTCSCAAAGVSPEEARDKSIVYGGEHGCIRPFNVVQVAVSQMGCNPSSPSSQFQLERKVSTNQLRRN